VSIYSIEANISMKLLFASFTILLCLCFVIAEVTNENNNDIGELKHAVRVTSRHEEPLENNLEDRASLLFRRLDTDFDKKIGVEDIRRGEQVLAEQIPGISVPQFIEFMEKADQDKDQHINREEFMQALSQGLTDANEAPGLIESESKVGFIGVIGDIAGNMKRKIRAHLNRIAGTIDTTQDACVTCQYIVERIETNVKASGVIPGLGSPGPAPGDAFSFVETEEKESEKGPWQAVGATIIGSTRQTTRYQRQIERQKYNEIYRVTDITLDDVCEQGMPNKYYGFCKSIYKVQSDIVDGLRYQYRPQDICYRVGMCDPKSYITQGIHSRYRTDN